MRVPFSAPWISMNDKRAVLSALSQRWLTGGPKTLRFEQSFAAQIGVKYAIAVNSCTSALHLAMRALNVGPGDEIIVPTLTFVATANAAILCGAKPVLADVDERTLCISAKDILPKISARTKGIVVVHYAGQPCDMDEILSIAKKKKLFVVEDCAHSLGAKYGRHETGSLGTAGCFSFYPTKNITTLEGGMITTDNSNIAKSAMLLRNHAMSRSAQNRESIGNWYYDVMDLGDNFRLNEIQSALGISQLRRLRTMNAMRARAARVYTKILASVKGILTPYEAGKRTHAYHLYVVRVLKERFGLSRDELYTRLVQRGIGLSVHYTPLHRLTFYKKFVGVHGNFPVADKVYPELLSLPIYPAIRMKQIEYVTEQIMKCQASP